METVGKKFKISLQIDNDSCYHITKTARRDVVVDGVVKSVEIEVVTPYIRGKASGVSRDLDGERMSESAIVSMQKSIANGIVADDGELGPIPLMSEHEYGWDDHLGYLTKAWIDDNFDLWIEAELIPDHPRSQYLYKTLTTNTGTRKKHGLSVGGYVLDAGYEFDEEIGKSVRVFTDIGLYEVSVTSRPAYATAFLDSLAKSVSWERVRTGKALVTEDIMKKFHADGSVTEVDDNMTNIAKSDAPAEEAVKSADAEVAAEVAEKSAEEERDFFAEAELEKSAEVEVAAEEVAEKSAEVEVVAEEVAEKSNSYADADLNINLRSYSDNPDPEGALNDILQGLVNEVSRIGSALKSLEERGSGGEAAVEKSEVPAEDTQGEEVAKSESEPVVDESAAAVVAKTETVVAESAEDVVSKGLVDAVGSALEAKLGPIAELLKSFESRLTGIESQEVDGSLSVSKAVDVGLYEQEEARNDLISEVNKAYDAPSQRIAALLQKSRGA